MGCASSNSSSAPVTSISNSDKPSEPKADAGAVPATNFAMEFSSSGRSDSTATGDGTEDVLLRSSLARPHHNEYPLPASTADLIDLDPTKRTMSPKTPTGFIAGWQERTGPQQFFLVRFPQDWSYSTFSKNDLLQHEVILSDNVGGARVYLTVTFNGLLQPPCKGRDEGSILARAFEDAVKLPNVERVWYEDNFKNRRAVCYSVVSHAATTNGDTARLEGTRIVGPHGLTTFEVVCSAPETSWFSYGPTFRALVQGLDLKWVPS